MERRSREHDAECAASLSTAQIATRPQYGDTWRDSIGICSCRYQRVQQRGRGYTMLCRSEKIEIERKREWKSGCLQVLHHVESSIQSWRVPTDEDFLVWVHSIWSSFCIEWRSKRSRCMLIYVKKWSRWGSWARLSRSLFTEHKRPPHLRNFRYLVLEE